MKNIVKNTLILFAITLVAGLGLGFVYNVTSKARNDQEEKTKMTAYESVMPGMESFENVKVDSACAKQTITSLLSKSLTVILMKW